MLTSEDITNPTDSAVRVENLSKSFVQNNQRIPVLNQINIEVKNHHILGLLGPNGAGKTTALRIIAGILEPDEGQVLIHNQNINTNSNIIKKEIGFLSSGTQLYPLYTPPEIFSFFGSVYGMNQLEIKQRTDELVAKLNLESLMSMKIQHMSTGQKQKVNIARTIFHNPSILILDEPTNGLDVLTTASVIDFIKSIKEEGKAIIYSTHILSEIELLTDSIAIIYGGKILASSSREEIIQSTGSNNLSQAFLQIIKNSTLNESLTVC